MGYGVVTTYTDGRRSTTIFDNYYFAQVALWEREADWINDPSIADIRISFIEGAYNGGQVLR